MSDRDVCVSRRTFFAGACQATAAAALATLFSNCGSGGSSSSPSGPSSTPTNLATVSGVFAGSKVMVSAAGSLANVGGAALVNSIAGSFLLSRSSATAFTAVEAICTHEGCTITETDGSIYVCPCHGSRYTRTGQVVFGPATASLRQYQTTFADGVVSISV